MSPREADAPSDPATEMPPALPYRLRWRPRGERPGAHPALGEGGDGTFRGLLPLIARPDPRRIDLRASLRDPFETIHVRNFAPRRAMTVAVLADVSASMAFDGVREAAAELAATLAASAIAGGDAFALLAADDEARDDIDLPASRRRGLAQEVRARLRDAPFTGRSAGGLAEAAVRLPQRRCLVFLVSDFLLPASDLAALLDALWRHDVVPVVLRDSRAEGDLPAFGLIEARDAETGGRRLVLMRPSLRERWRAQAKSRIAALDDLFAGRGLGAFHLSDRFDADALADFLAHR